jgi:geranylgeranyl diphosphate synthase type I
VTTVDIGQTERSAREVLDSCRERVEPALRGAVDSALPPAIQDIVGYHFGWLEEHGKPAEAGGGKAIRPALALTSAAAVGAAGAVAIPAAVAVELVHNFSLLHDDVMDHDVTRRHRRTAWAVFGIGPAILAGDSLLTLAMEVLASSGHPDAEQGVQLLSGAVQNLVDGQLADLAFEKRSDVGLSECLVMAGGKTGSLLGCACALGALFGGGRPDQVSRLHRFGSELGLAFQFVDDLLGIWGDPETTGKPVHSDLRSRKKTLPVVAALTSGTRAGRQLAELYHREQEMSAGELARAAELIELTGARTWCRSQADDLIADALRELSAAHPAAGAAAQLRVLARLAARRDH